MCPRVQCGRICRGATGVAHRGRPARRLPDCLQLRYRQQLVPLIAVHGRVMDHAGCAWERLKIVASDLGERQARCLRRPGGALVKHPQEETCQTHGR